VGDIDNDQDDDLVWIDTTNSSVVAWRMNGLVKTNVTLGTAASREYLCMADVDADGDDDIFWRRNSDRQINVWVLEDGAVNSNSAIEGNPTGVNIVWSVRSVADFNDDGKADLLWRNSTTGQLVCWYFNNLLVAGINQIATNPGPGVDVQDLTDIDGDNDPDVLFRATGGGTISAWTMDGITIESSTVIRTLPNGARYLR
jgi:hypothetical protein